MFNIRNEIEKEQYIQTNNDIKQLNENRALLKKKLEQNNFRFKFKKIFIKENDIKNNLNRGATNYFLNYKIAVYTCIIGEYDILEEPIMKPDNCDFYVITDQKISSSSVWKKIDPYQYIKKGNFTDIMINRYFKMNPHLIFKDYKYSFYVDGNFKILTDMTEHINRISNYGLAFFGHPERQCVFEEISVCIEMKKCSADKLNEQKEYLKENKMPLNYGLLAACIIAREHNNLHCREIMENWWKEFLKFPYRDQLSLPFVLYKMGIEIKDISTLGDNCWEERSLIRYYHK